MENKKTKPKTPKSSKKKGDKKQEDKVSYHRRPENLELDTWQFLLRKKFGEENPFEVTNIGGNKVFSDFKVLNPDAQSGYTVTIRNGENRFPKMPKASLYRAHNACTCQDFRTNRLGICKHVSATLKYLSGIRGNKKQLKSDHHQPETFIYLDYKNGRQIRLCIGAEQQPVFTEWATKYFDTEGVILKTALSAFDAIIQEGKAIAASFKCTPDAFDFILQQQENNRRFKILKEKIPHNFNDSYFDSLLKVPLFPYQKTGAYFAAQAGRCLIADEMGLGKTIQALAAAEIYKKELGIKKILVICPTSLKYQWKTEIEKFTDNTVHVVEGTMVNRRKQYGTSDALYEIMSYQVVVNDAEYINDLLKPDLVILDEAQRIKNFRTKVSARLKQVQTPYSFVLTGTPIENKLDELYSIVQFIDQFKLPPLYRFLDRYQISDANGRVVGFRNLKEISTLLSDCMIRRIKKDVLKQLPKRMDKTLFVPMTKEQMGMHNELADIVAQLVAKWQRFHFLNEQDRQRLLLCLSQMRMVCDSTFILDQKTRFDTKITELMCILEEALTDDNQKVVVFSQWERMTRLVAEELQERGIGFASLHGGVQSKNRAKLLDDFANDADCRIFLSTDAGGVGLNLQSASLLINLDVPWNPAILEQRIGRIYRMGQSQNVTIINMVATQTIEHRMLGVLEFKGEMAKGVLDPEGDDTIFMSESKFRRFMENVESLSSTTHTVLSEPAMENQAEEVDDLESDMPTEGVGMPDSTLSDTFEDNDIAPQPAPEMPKQPLPQQEEHVPQPAQNSAKSPTPEQTEEPQRLSRATATPALSSPQELIQTGMSFFTHLAQTLKSPEKTQELVSSIVKKDEITGQTYLHIPIDNQEVVSNALSVLGSLFGSMMK